MGQFRAIALRAIAQRREGKPKMISPFTLTRLGVFSFWFSSHNQTAKKAPKNFFSTLNLLLFQL
jgi:hypothetical protein